MHWPAASGRLFTSGEGPAIGLKFQGACADYMINKESYGL